MSEIILLALGDVVGPEAVRYISGKLWGFRREKKIDIVVCKVPVETLLATVQKTLYTGNIGDGKVFLFDVEDVLKIRTGERGYDALQDEPDASA